MTPSFLVYLRRAFLHDWFVVDRLDGQALAKPFIAHAMLMLSTYDHRLQAIRRGTCAHRVVEGDLAPKQILGRTSPSMERRPDSDSIRSSPDSPDIIIIEDDEDVRAWMIAAANRDVLRLCVVFHKRTVPGT